MVLRYKLNWGLNPENECCMNSQMSFFLAQKSRAFDLMSLLHFIIKNDFLYNVYRTVWTKINCRDALKS